MGVGLRGEARDGQGVGVGLRGGAGHGGVVGS